jgi:hypothetical protein
MNLVVVSHGVCQQRYTSWRALGRRQAHSCTPPAWKFLFHLRISATAAYERQSLRMPVAKSKRRQAIAPKRADADASLDVDLAEIDIKGVLHCAGDVSMGFRPQTPHLHKRLTNGW